MAKDDLLEGYWRYLMEAFHRRTGIPFLGQLPLNKMALGALLVLGLLNPGFWLLGLAGEALYLVLKASNPRFQKLIQAEKLMESQQSWGERVASAVAKLTSGSRDRYRRLLTQCRLILGISESLDADSLGNFRDLRARSLNQLLAIFLRLLGSREVIAANLSHVERPQLEHDIATLEKRLADAAADPALTRSLQGTLDIQRKRLDNLTRAQGSLAVIDSELVRIEQQVELIREESAVTGRPEALSERLDAVTSTMGETTRWMDEHADFFGSLAGDAGAALPDLPALQEELPKLLEHLPTVDEDSPKLLDRLPKTRKEAE